MSQALVCDRCGKVVRFSKDKHDTTMFQVEWHPYISTRNVDGCLGVSRDICQDCMNAIFNFIGTNKEEEVEE